MRPDGLRGGYEGRGGALAHFSTRRAKQKTFVSKLLPGRLNWLDISEVVLDPTTRRLTALEKVPHIDTLTYENCL